MKSFYSLVSGISLVAICSCTDEKATEINSHVTSGIIQTNKTSPADEPKGKSVYVESTGWVVCRNLKLGINTKIGRAFLRSVADFGVEIFFGNGVITVPFELLPQEVSDALKTLKSPPHSMPSEFNVPEAEYMLYSDGVKLGNTVEALFERYGIPYAGRPIYDVITEQQLHEYFWQIKSSEWFLGAVTEDDKAVRKCLMKSLKPLQ